MCTILKKAVTTQNSIDATKSLHDSLKESVEGVTDMQEFA